jgi:HEAT repeat protein
MGWLGSEAAQRALTRLLGRDLIRAQVVEALVRYGAGVVTLLIEQLHAEDLETRQAAAVALGRIGDRRATPALVEALAERELAVVAAGALARIGDSAAFDPLMSLLGDQDSAIRQAAIAALNSIGHADMPHRIVTLLADADPIVRESAVRIAGYFGYESCLARVLDRCHDEHEPVRRTAVEQLAQFDGPEAFEMLTQAIHDESPRVRAAACAALVRSEHPARVEVLRDALIDADPWVRYVAVRSLGVIGDTSVVPAILTALERDTAPHVRLAAIEVVGRLQPDDALQILEPLAQASDHDVARAAIAALGHVDRPDALRVLESLLRAPEPLRRHAAIDALAVRHDTRVPHMLQWVAAADEQPNIVEAAVDALARVGVREDQQAGEATRALIALTAEPTRRERAISALSNLPARRIPDIAGGLRHPATDVRRASVQVLSRMKQPDASRELEFALLDVSPSVRLTAVSEIKRLGTRGSQGTLMRLARTDPDRDVRQAAMLAVARMDGAPGEFEPRTSAGS